MIANQSEQWVFQLIYNMLKRPGMRLYTNILLLAVIRIGWHNWLHLHITVSQKGDYSLTVSKQRMNPNFVICKLCFMVWCIQKSQSVVLYLLNQLKEPLLKKCLNLVWIYISTEAKLLDRTIMHCYKWLIEANESL